MTAITEIAIKVADYKLSVSDNL
ncbi:339273fa-2662-42bf-9d25-c2f905c30734 [Thermothielavioides terrestris]|uniref:339273fa-2662-42bf-9d25-c2f905c30734 n=1 Tax=Thermothielavioides terrestris TaxID=2587410 RepID=A0A446BDY0_9PEZI|nr:339273fa-2662-42bf-9d25-c2f905c30734 [Thermothielavioides terrestris]